MVTIVKHEWHSVDSQFALELDEALLSEIYPDMDEDEISNLLVQIQDGEISVEDIVNDAWENGIDLEWDRQYDDWYTDRKGGYDITYELGDDSSWVQPPEEPKSTHKCTKCRWEGNKYETLTQYLREDGTVIADYFSSDEESSDTKEVCPMCDGDVILTEHGIDEEEKRKKLFNDLDSLHDDDTN